jgi:hypothetical protein
MLLRRIDVWRCHYVVPKHRDPVTHWRRVISHEISSDTRLRKHQNPRIWNIIQWALRMNLQRPSCTISFIQGLWKVTWPSSFVTPTPNCRLKCGSLGPLHNFTIQAFLNIYIYCGMVNDIDQTTSIWQPMSIHFYQTICCNDALSSFCADGSGMISLSRTGEGQMTSDLLVF